MVNVGFRDNKNDNEFCIPRTWDDHLNYRYCVKCDADQTECRACGEVLRKKRQDPNKIDFVPFDERYA